MNRCRSCKAPIAWATMLATGKGCPVDAYETGVPALFEGGGLRVVSSHPLIVEPRHGEPGLRSHFASCPNAKQHRRRDQPDPFKEIA